VSVEAIASRRRPLIRQTKVDTVDTGHQQWSDQLVGDAATQLCHPLAQINDSIAAVLAVDSGLLSSEQQIALRDAMAACNQMDTVVERLRRLNRRRQPTEVHRQWFELSSLRDSTTELFKRQMPHRRDAIRWHGFDRQHRVYGDVKIASQLLASWLGSAMRNSGSCLVGGKAILVRANGLPDRHCVRLSVSVEDGCIFGSNAESVTNSVARKKDDWLELGFWRLFAASLWAHPEITLRHNGGWQIGIDLPLESPLSVAAQWARWRQAQHWRTQAYPSSSVDPVGKVTDQSTTPRMMVAENSSGKSVNHFKRCTMAGAVGPGPIHLRQATVLTVIAGAAVSPQAIEAFDKKLRSDQGMYDFVYRVSSRRWVVVWDANTAEADIRIDTLGSGNLDSASPIRLQWSSIAVLPIRDGQTARILADRLARELLTDPDSDYTAIDRPVDSVQIRPSAIPTDRLMAEMRHLAQRVRVQNDHLINQASQLRPVLMQHRPSYE
jgi:hypothetical protein